MNSSIRLPPPFIVVRSNSRSQQQLTPEDSSQPIPTVAQQVFAEPSVEVKNAAHMLVALHYSPILSAQLPLSTSQITSLITRKRSREENDSQTSEDETLKSLSSLSNSLYTPRQKCRHTNTAPTLLRQARRMTPGKQKHMTVLSNSKRWPAEDTIIVKEIVSRGLNSLTPDRQNSMISKIDQVFQQKYHPNPSPYSISAIRGKVQRAIHINRRSRETERP